MKKIFFSLFIVLINFFNNNVYATPSTHASGVYFDNVTTTSFRVNWTNGNGTTRLVVVRPSGNSVAFPTNGFGVYLASSTYGGGTNLGSSNYVVYKGSGSSVTVSGLSLYTGYRVTIFEYDWNIFTGNQYLTSSGYPNEYQSTLDTEPTTAASSATVTSISSTSAYISWTNGNGARRLVSLRAGATNTILPIDGNTYTPNSTFGSGTNLGSGAYVVYTSTGSGCWVYGLTPETQYTASVFEYNGQSTGQNYKTTGYPSATFYSQASEPTAASTDIEFTKVTENSMTVNWQRGNGVRRIVTAKAASTNTHLPSDFTSYTASTVFGSGTQIGATGAYVVYNGTGNYVNVTGLSAQTTYAFSVFEYNGSSVSTYNFLTSTYATGAQQTQRNNPGVEASSLGFSGISSNSVTASWTNGNGSNRVVAIRSGRLQTAISFDGSNDYINIPHASSFNTLPVTLSTWVKTTQSSGSWVGLVGKYVIGSLNGYQLYMDNGSINAWYFGNSSNYIYPTGSNNGGRIDDGEWHHIAYVVDNSGGKLYVDGVLRNNSPWTGTPTVCTTTQNTMMGFVSGGGYFNGKLDEVQVWNTALSQTQIRANMYKSLYGNETGLLGYWKLDEGFASSSTAVNSCITSSGTNGTLTNFASVAAATGFINSSGWIYSGAGVNQPLDLNSYTGNATFLNGTQIGTGYYTAYNGNSNSVNISGLAPNTYYNVSVFEYNGTQGSATENYHTNQYATADFITSSVSAPTITSFSPSSGTLGTLVTINGTNFSANAADNIVYFGASQATVSSATPTQLVVIVPNGANYLPISVSVNSLTAFSASPFVVTTSCAGSISFAAPTNLTIDASSYANTVADIDGDGKPEVLSANYFSNKLSVYRNLSTSSIAFASKSDFTTYTGPVGLTVADFDGDGKKDVVVANYTNVNGFGIISYFRNTSTPGSISFATRVDFSVKSYPWSFAAADIDKDGKTDLVVGYYTGDSITVVRNTGSIGNAEFVTQKSFFTGASSYPRKIAVSDLDADGKTDIAVACYNTTKITVFKNTSTTGNITMNTGVDYTMPSNARSIAIGDLDNDSKPDIVATAVTNALRVFKNTTSGTINASSFSTTTNLSLPGGRNPDDVILMDVDGDGSSRTDIVTGYESSLSAVSSFKNNGSMSFAAYADHSLSSSSGPRFICGGDLNADGKPDVVTSTSGTSICVLQNTNNPLVAEPNGAASGIGFTGVSTTSMTVSWTNGQGVNRVVIAKAVSSPVTQAPFDGVNYSANSIFGSGTHLGGGNYVVYNGNGTSVNVTGLQSNTTYMFSVYEYNGSVACELNYLTSSSLSGTKATLNVQPTLTSIGNPSAICQNSSLQTVNLSGISSGTVTETQTLVVTAVSSNVSLIPHPTVSYVSPATTGTLSYTPNTGVYGTAVITVTVDDGATNNNTIVRTFTITVSQFPTTATTGSFQQICAAQTNLTGNSPSVGTGAWSYIYRTHTGITVSNSASPTSLITGFNVGDSARVRWTISNGGCTASYAEMSVKRINCPLTADFTTTSATTQCLNATPSVLFADASASSGTTIQTWNWSFGSGATPSTATGQGPHTVGYSTSGVKTVTLIVTDNTLAKDTAIKNSFINIVDVPSAAGTITGQLATVCQGQTGVLYTIGAVSGATGYSWSLPTGASISSNPTNDSVYVDFGLSAVSGNITVQGTNTCGSGTASSAYPVTVNALPVAAGAITGSLTVCEGTSGVVYSVTSITGAISHVWSIPSGASITNGAGTNSITVDFTGAVSGNIKVYGQNTCGKGDSTEIAVTVNPLPAAAGSISGQSIINLCPLATGVNYSVGFINNADYYLWTLPSGVTVVSGDSTNSIVVDYSLNSVSGNITVKGVNTCGDGATATLPINIYTVPNIPICLVTVDTTSTFNRVVWEKPITNDIDSFRIYREITSSFVHIASVAYDSLSVYNDKTYLPAANPNITSHRYKISVIDTCGNEWNLSQPHKTILLQASIGTSGEVNLSWNDYEGAAVSFFRIYRDSFGTGNYILIDSVATSSGGYVDLTPPVSSNLSYVLETNWGVSCSPTEAAISTTRSNAKGGLVISPTGMHKQLNEEVMITPNPNKGVFTINYPLSVSGYTIEIYNSVGQKMYSDYLTNNGNLTYKQLKQIDISDMGAGVYSVVIYSETGIRLVKKLVVN